MQYHRTTRQQFGYKWGPGDHHFINHHDMQANILCLLGPLSSSAFFFLNLVLLTRCGCAPFKPPSILITARPIQGQALSIIWCDSPLEPHSCSTESAQRCQQSVYIWSLSGSSAWCRLLVQRTNTPSLSPPSSALTTLTSSRTASSPHQPPQHSHKLTRCASWYTRK